MSDRGRSGPPAAAPGAQSAAAGDAPPAPAPAPAAFAYLGDALHGAGFRLAGGLAWTPAPGTEAAALRQACARAQAVLIAAEVAARLPPAQLAAALAAGAPPVAIVAGGDGASPLDPAQRVRAQLGLEP